MRAERVVDEATLGGVGEIEAAAHHLVIGVVEVLLLLVLVLLALLGERRLVLAALDVHEHRRRARDVLEAPEIDLDEEVLVLVRRRDLAHLDTQRKRVGRAERRRVDVRVVRDDGRGAVCVLHGGRRPLVVGRHPVRCRRHAPRKQHEERGHHPLPAREDLTTTTRAPANEREREQRRHRGRCAAERRPRQKGERDVVHARGQIDGEEALVRDHLADRSMPARRPVLVDEQTRGSRDVGVDDDLVRRPRDALHPTGIGGVGREVLLLWEIAAQQRRFGEAMRLVAAERADVLRLEVHGEPAITARLVELAPAIGGDGTERAMGRNTVKGRNFPADRE